MNEFCDSMGIYALTTGGGGAAGSQTSLKTRWNAIGNGSAATGVVPGQGNRGNPALYLPFGATIGKTFTRQPTFTVGFRLNMASVAGVGGNSTALIQYKTVNAGQSWVLVGLVVKGDGSIYVFGNNNTATVILTTAVVITASVDCYLELSATISGTTNMLVAAEVKVNGLTVGTGSANIGANAASFAYGAAFKSLALTAGVETSGQSYISDFYINNALGSTNTGFLADTIAPYLEVGYLLPRADGTTLDWTPLSGVVHYTEINEIPQDGNSSYNASATPGNIDSYFWQPVPGFSGTIPTVQLSYCGSSDQEGLRTFKGNIGAGGAQQQTAEFGLCSSIYYRSAQFDLDPVTGLPWTQAAFNARQFGIGLVR